MTSNTPSIIHHISVGTNDFARARAFYDPVMASLGCKPVMEYPDAVAYGRQSPEFWVQIPKDKQTATIGNGSHVGFIAQSREQVHAFYDAALAYGGTDDGPPGPREEYTPAYYGCFVLDPDGHQIEATFWDEAVYQQWLAGGGNSQVSLVCVQSSLQYPD